MGNWIPKTFDEACRRAAGRRRYLAQRREIQSKRQTAVLAALRAQGWLTEHWQSYGVGRTLARQFNVSEATISRDLHHFMKMRRTIGERAEDVFDLMLRDRPQETSEPVTKHKKTQELSQPAPEVISPEELPKNCTVIESLDPENPLALIPTGDPLKPLRVIRFRRPMPNMPSGSESTEHWLVRRMKTLQS